MRLVIEINLEEAYSDRIEQTQENINKLLLTDKQFNNEILHLLKQNLKCGCFRIED
jgi:hypothetical protein